MTSLNNVMGGNPILTVVLFTILLRLVMSPADIVSRKAMQKQQAAQPYIAKIQKRYAGNPQVMQKKLSEFNKKHGISMLKGCLPMLITWPLFIIFLDAMNYWGYVSNINIFLQADLPDRVERAIHTYHHDPQGAESMVIKTDKRRANYYNYFTGGKWGKAENYDLILNTSRMDLDKIVEVIKTYVSLR